MKKRLPPLNWLRSFEASARLLNFTQAANELHMTQAAISQQVKGLESQLGTALFRRLPRGLELTEAGQAYLPAVHEAVERLSAATDEIFGQGRTELLTIRANLVFFTRWLSPRLHKFRQLHPEIGLKFTSNIWMEEQKHDADFEIRYGHGIWPGLKTDRLTWDELFPVCSPDLLKAGPALADSDDESVTHAPKAQIAKLLTEHPLLHVIGYEEGWGFWLKKAGLSDVEMSQSFQFDTLISALDMAVHGQGVALGRTSLVADLLESGQLVAPFEQRLPTAEAFHLTRREHGYIHPNAEIFREWIISEAGATQEISA